MKTKTKKTKKPIVKTMWALRWFYFDGKKNPNPKTEGAWMLCCTKELAERNRLDAKQKITRVRVTILP